MDDWTDANRKRPVSATDAAFAGFTLVRERPGVFGAIVLVSAVFYLAVLWIQSVWILPPMMRMVQAQQAAVAAGAAPDPMASINLVGSLFPFQLLMLVASAVFGAVINAAVFRAFLRPKERGFGSVRAGADELRQLGLLLEFFLLFIGLYIGSLVLAVIVGIASAMIAAGAGEAASGPGMRVALVLLIVACILLPMLVAGVRLSLSGPMTLARRKVMLFASWRLTRGRFWSILGAYVLAFFVMLVVSLLFFVVALVVVLVAGGGLHAVMPDPRTLTSGMMFSPVAILWAVLNAPLAALWYVVFGGVAASVYAQIAGGPDPAYAGSDRSHAFGAAPAPVPPPPTTEYPIVPPRETPPPDEL